MKKPFPLISVAAATLALLSITTIVADETQMPGTFKVVTKQKKDRVKVSGKGDQTVFSITSPRGIGGATIQRTAAHWPKEVVVRLHFRGLESFSVSNGKIKLSASVLSHSGNTRLLHLWEEGKEGPRLDKDSPYWMDIRVADAQGKPAGGLPQGHGYFEMILPKALFGGNPKSLNLGWIDFYRR